MFISRQKAAIIAAYLSTSSWATPIQDVSPAIVGQHHALGKRDLTSMQCGNYATADPGDTFSNIKNIHDKSGNAVVAPKTCSRLGCYNTSGVYMCNDSEQEASIPLVDVGGRLNGLFQTCSVGGSGGISGQMYSTDGPGYNLVIGFCDSHDPTDKKPSDYPGPGINGNPRFKCGVPGTDDCSWNAICDAAHGLTITDSEDVDCPVQQTHSGIQAGETNAVQTTVTVGTTWTYGVNLGLKLGDIFSAAGGSVSYAESYQFATAQTTSNTCGASGARGDWTCGWEVTPRCHRVSGTCRGKITSKQGFTYNGGGWASTGDQELGLIAFQVTVPLQNTTPSQIMCTCKNCKGWADNGAPVQMCKDNCNQCIDP